MTNKGRLIIVLSFLIVLFALLVSCEEPKAEFSGKYNTPTITGTVSLPESSGLKSSDIWVKVIDSNGQTKNVSRASADGSFAISGLKENEKYEVFFTSEEPDHANYSKSAKGPTSTNGFGGWLGSVDAAINDGNNVGSVKMKPLGTIKGKTTYKDATEHYDIDVYIPGTSYIAKTAEDGSWSIFNVPQGTYRIRMASAGYIAQMMENINLVGPDGDYETNPVLVVKDTTLIRYEGAVSGRATISGSGDSAGISVSLEGENAEGDESVVTAKDGTYTIPDVNPGTYKLVIQKAGYVTREIDGIIVKSSETYEAEEVSLIRRTATISGKATISGAEDSAGISVLLESSDGKHSYLASTDSAGNYAFPDVEPGTYSLVASMKEYISRVAEGIKVVSSQEFELEPIVLVKRTGTVTGKATISGSGDSSGITVSLEGESADGDESVVTAKDGTYTIPDVNPGTYKLVIQKAGYVTREIDGIIVKSSETTIIEDIRLNKSTAFVEGVVELSGSKSYEGVAVLLKTTEGNIQYSATTDQNGRYIFNEVAPDSYMLIASKDGYISATVAGIEINAADFKNVGKVVLSEAQRSISGRMTMEGKTDHSGISITATNINETTIVYAALTNSEGYYSFSGMKPGEYIISASSAGYVNTTLPTVNVTNSSLSSVGESELKIARGLITGIAKLEGRTDFSGITVDLVGTEYSTETDAEGVYEFSVPSGNYAGGVRFSHGYYETASDTETITVLTNGSYGVPEVELECLYADVEGIVDVLGTDDNSGVKVTVASREMTTESDGSFSFGKVALGEYTLTLERENTPKVTAEIKIEPTAKLDLGAYTMIPNSASINGMVKLDGMSNHSGITVTARGNNGSTLSSKTEESGYFYMGGLISSATYSVSFEKDGWDTPDAITVTGLQSLEERDITKSADVVMYDTTAPSFDSIIINTGVGTTSNRVVTLHINAEDKGSGIEYMQICTDNIFDRTVTMREYIPSYEYELPEGNGERTVYVKLHDKSGNESVVKSSTVTLTDQKKEVKGVLFGDDLHWTKEMSPYYVTGNLMVEDGDTLTIDPGVDVQFAGAYSLTVRGTLDAVGTEEERISIYGVESGVDTWEGIRFEGRSVFGGTETHPVLSEGSILSNADVYGNKGGISGKAWLDNVKVDAESFALGDAYDWSDTYIERYFTGIAVESEFNGNIAMQKASVYDSTLSFGTCYNDDYDGRETYYQGSVLDGETMQSFYGINNKVSVDSIAVVGDTSSCTFIESELSILKHDHFSNSYEKCSFSEFRPEKFEFNNMDGCDAIATLSYGTGEDDSPEVINMRNCFWGYDKTRELKTGVLNMSFIDDYYDGDFDKSKIDYSCYSEEPYPFAGFVGESYLFMPEASVDASGVESHVTVANDRTIITDNAATINLSVVGDEEYSQYRIFSYSSDSFDDDNWKDINGTEIEFMFDPEVNSNLFDHYIQFRDEEGKETAVYAISIGFVVKGPSGGYIFYDKGYVSDGWRYMEADSEDYSEKEWVVDDWYPEGGYWRTNHHFRFGLYRKTDYGTNLYVNGKEEYSDDCTSTGIGSGKRNTEMLVEAMGDYAYSELEGPEKTDKYAAKICYDHEKNGYDDWFLPSRDELNQMHERLHQNGIGSFSDDNSWSSSEYNDYVDAYFAWYQVVPGYQPYLNRNLAFSIRPCRAF